MQLSGRTLKNKYRIKGLLYTDTLKDIYRAVDVENGNGEVSITVYRKTSVSARAEDVIRFNSSITRIIGKNHDNILALHDTGEIFDSPFVVHESTGGRFLTDYIVRGSLDFAVDITMQVARGLAHIHDLGIVHRHINPRNIDISSGAAKIANIGISHIFEFGEMAEPAEINSIFKFYSPEQNGILRRTVDERSDLFSLGAVFYWLLTGKEPFTGEDICTIMHRQMASAPVDPGLYNDSVPPILREILFKLLEKEPRDRYQTARGLLDDLERFKKGDARFIPGIKDRSPRISFQSDMIGRTEERALLTGFLDNMKKGRGSICFITGDAGVGKSKLIEEFKQSVYEKELTYIYVKCFEGHDAMPYRPIRDLMDSYLAVFNTYSDERKRHISKILKKQFGDQGEIILSFNPMMSEIIGETGLPVNPGKGIENVKFHVVLSRFFLALSDIEDGLVVVMEDLQWIDTGSLIIGSEILKKIESLSLLLICTFRDDAVMTDNRLAMMVDNVRSNAGILDLMHITPFDVDGTNKLAASILHEKEERTRNFSEYIYRKSKGNVLFSITILREFIERGILSFSNDAWVFDEKLYKEIEIPQSLLDIILSRIDFLDNTEKKLLSYAAAMGMEFELQLLFELSSLENDAIVTIIDRALQFQLLEMLQSAGNKYMFSHDRIQEALYRGIDENEKNEIHLKIATALEQMHGDNLVGVIFELAYHYRESGDRGKSLQFAYPAGLLAMEQFANDEACKYFLTVRDMLGSDSSNQLWFDCREKLGIIDTMAGRYDSAVDYFNEILENLEDDRLKPTVLIHLSNTYYRKGDWEACETSAFRGLALLGESIPEKTAAVRFAYARELFVHLLYKIIFRGKRRSGKGAELTRYKMIVGFYQALVHNYTFYNNPPKFLLSTLRTVNISERHIGPSQEMSISLCGMGVLFCGTYMFKLAQSYYDRALAVSRSIKDRWGEGYSYGLTGYIVERDGRFLDAISEYYQKSMSLFREVGDTMNIGMICFGMARAYYFLSDYENSLVYCDTNYDIAGSTNEKFLMSAACVNYAMVYREMGETDKALTYAEKARKISSESNVLLYYCSSLIELGMLASERGDYGAAIGYLEEARTLYKKSMIVYLQTVHLYIHLAEARIHDYIQREDDISPKEKKTYLKKITKACRSAMKIGKKWPPYYGRSCRIMGLYYALLGKHKKAEKYFRLSIDHSAVLGMRFDNARGHLEYGLYLMQINRKDEARKNLESAYVIFDEIGAGASAVMVGKMLGVDTGSTGVRSIDRFIKKERHSQLDTFRRNISEIDDTDELLNEIIKKTMEYAGAGSGYLFLLDKTGETLELVASRTKEVLPGELAVMKLISKKIMKEGQYSVIEKDEIDGLALSNGLVNMLGNSRIMCLPLGGHGGSVGACCLENPYSSELLPDDELLVVQDLLSHAGMLIYRSPEDNAKNSDSVKTELTITVSAEFKIKKAIQYIEENYISDISRDGLAASLDLSPNYFGKLFRKYTGMKFNDYINKLRVDKAIEMLVDSEDRIIDIAYAVGFENLRTFNRAFLKETSTNPQKFRQEKR